MRAVLYVDPSGCGRHRSSKDASTRRPSGTSVGAAAAVARGGRSRSPRSRPIHELGIGASRWRGWLPEPSELEADDGRALAAPARAVWLYWPEEGLVEVATPERLGSYRRHWLMINFYRFVVRAVLTRVVAGPMTPQLRDARYAAARDAGMDGAAHRAHDPCARRHRPTRQVPDRRSILRPRGGAKPPLPPMVRHAQRLANARAKPVRRREPIPFPAFAGVGPIDCGRFGVRRLPPHRFLGAASSRAAATATRATSRRSSPRSPSLSSASWRIRFRLLDEFGLRQVVMPRPSATNNEDDIAVRDAVLPAPAAPCVSKQLQPAYIYERLCLGNSAGALLSAELRDPVHRRIQRLRNLDAAQLRRHRLRLRGRVPRDGGAGVRAGDAHQRRLVGDPQPACWRAGSTRRRSRQPERRRSRRVCPGAAGAA